MRRQLQYILRKNDENIIAARPANEKVRHAPRGYQVCNSPVVSKSLRVVNLTMARFVRFHVNGQGGIVSFLWQCYLSIYVDHKA